MKGSKKNTRQNRVQTRDAGGSCKDKLHLESDVPGGEEVTKDARAD